MCLQRESPTRMPRVSWLLCEDSELEVIPRVDWPQQMFYLRLVLPYSCPTPLPCMIPASHPSPHGVLGECSLKF